MTWITPSGVVTHLKPYILECEVKWALGSITMKKASGSDGIPAELFQILKDDAVKVRTQYVSKFGKHSFHSSPKEGQSQRILNYHTTAFISHASKFMLKILQDRLQQYPREL